MFTTTPAATGYFGKTNWRMCVSRFMLIGEQTDKFGVCRVTLAQLSAYARMKVEVEVTLGHVIGLVAMKVEVILTTIAERIGVTFNERRQTF